jgi:hypothetical protein
LPLRCHVGSALYTKMPAVSAAHLWNFVTLFTPIRISSIRC